MFVLILLLTVPTSRCDGGTSSYPSAVDTEAFGYYASGPLYAAVLVPERVGLSRAAQVPDVVFPWSHSTVSGPSVRIRDASAAADPRPDARLRGVPIYRFDEQTIVGRPAFSLDVKRVRGSRDSVYGLSGIAATKSSSSLVRPGPDVSGRRDQETSSNSFSGTVRPSTGSALGSIKGNLDRLRRNRPVAGLLRGHAIYQKSKGPTHRHPVYPAKKMRIYAHVHKDHVHNHFLPSDHLSSAQKIRRPVKHVPSAAHSTSTTSTGAVLAYVPTRTVAFPENADDVRTSSTDERTGGRDESNRVLGEVTRAIFKGPGVVDVYDASVPLAMPAKKPYRFLIDDILRNSDFHFVRENTAPGTDAVPPHPEPATHPSSEGLGLAGPFLGSRPNGPVRAFSASIPPDPHDLFPVTNAFLQTNRIVDSGTSESVRYPVAVIGGAHDIAGRGMFRGFASTKRQDENAAKVFVPSRQTSDWIPTSGRGMPLFPGENDPEKKEDGTANETLTVGNVISGRIPEEFSREEQEQNRDETESRRKGTVFDVLPSSAPSEASEIGDTSDLVVSSVIKFS